MGSKLAVQAFESDLRQLVPAEAGQVFEELRGRVVGSDAFDKAPPGVDGMAVLVRAHPTLQSNLVDFLEALPAERCGPWVTAGWGNAINDAANLARYDRLQEKWSKEGSQMLKAAATTSRRTRTGTR